MKRISYDKLRGILAGQNMSFEQLGNEAGLTDDTVKQLQTDGYIFLADFVSICRTLKCQISNIFEIVEA